MRNFASLLILALCCHLTACQGDPDIRETITDLRVMAIQAEPPEAKPDTKIKMAVLAAMVPNQTITYKWYLCEDPAQAADGCHLGQAKAFSEDASPELTVPANYLEKIEDPLVKLRGRYLFVTLVATAGKQEVVATKRIVITTSPSNQNPSLDTPKVFGKDGKTEQKAPYSAALEQNVKLVPTPGKDAVQEYEIIDPNGQKTKAKERLFYSWYTTASTYSKGYLTQSSAADNTWNAPKEAPKTPKVKLYIIVRDGRGGVAWTDVEIDVK